MEGTSQTTAREDSREDVSARQLALRWVWPRPRLDRLQGGRLELGRDAAAAVRLDGPGVSRHHAELYRQGPLYVLRDLGSTNGTWFGGRPVEHAPIALGGVLRLGDWVGIVIECGDRDIEFGEQVSGVFGGREIAQLLDPMKRAAASNVPILLVGETGTGKERLARAVHQYSGRIGPILAINCAALPEHLAEAELFGYRRGAFTGAERSNPGYFRAAHGGTLFLDEMPELSPLLQAKLLRVVEDGQVFGLGESASTSVDVRIVSASQKPLPDLVASKRLRDDLAARLTGLELRLPPLAARRCDVAPLFQHFLKQQTGGRPPDVEARLIEALCLHEWPQNVRELELLTRTLLAVHGHEPVLKRQHLPPVIAATVQDRPRIERAPAPRARRDHDLARLDAVLSNNGGNVKAAAEALGISRQRIYRLLEGRGEMSNGNDPTGGDSGGARD